MPSGKGKALCCNKSAFKKFCPLYYIVIVIVDEQLAAYALKIYHNCKKDDELVRLLRSYAKQISINAMKKNGAPLLGLAKYIYYFSPGVLRAVTYQRKCFLSNTVNCHL